jgi:hypothetical protein
MSLLNFYFVLMCSFRFYFANRICLKFKLHLDSNWFAFIKGFVNGKAFLFLLAAWAETHYQPSRFPPPLPDTQPS